MRWRWVKGLIGIILVVLLVIESYYLPETSMNVSNEVTEPPIFKVNKEEKIASITFDINWAEKDNLENILNILDKYNVKATFFIMGGWVNYSEENVTKLKSINERGHEIGGHSYKHSMFTKISKERMLEELKKTDDIIEQVTGEKTKLFRFPSGDYNENACKVVREQGYIPIQWNVDSVDWKEQGEEIEYKRVKNKMENGSILLFHNNAKYTPKNLDRLIKELTEEGYSFVPVGKLIYSENYYVDKSGTQYRKN